MLFTGDQRRICPASVIRKVQHAVLELLEVIIDIKHVSLPILAFLTSSVITVILFHFSESHQLVISEFPYVGRLDGCFWNFRDEMVVEVVATVGGGRCRCRRS